MLVTFSTEDGSFSEQIDVDLNMPVTELKQLLEALTGIPALNQVFISNGAELGNSGSLLDIGIKENDLVLIVQTRPKPTQSRPRSTPAQQHAGGNGMRFEDVLETFKDPADIVRVVQANENLMRQANFHSPVLGELFAKDAATATKELRKFMLVNSAKMAMNRLKRQGLETEMQRRIEENPEDVEAKKYFQEKERIMIIEEQLMHIMNEYPESMTRVLMLYINVEINKHPVQAFVDSGAQTSVMSLSCAKRLEIDHLIDERFSANMVGVGSAKSLGRIHLAPLNIEGNFLPLTVTILDDENGLGDKNMEFLLGLDMLKRHRCEIDLVKGVLRFQGAAGAACETPFLHEKDLPENKGGTLGFDPNKANDNKSNKE